MKKRSQSVILPGAPTIRTIKRAIVSPLTGKYVENASGTVPFKDEFKRYNWLAGVFHGDGKPVESAMLRRGTRGRIKACSVQECGDLQTHAERKFLAGTSIYGGVYVEHFGHFILDTLSRWWAIRALPDYNYLILHTSSPVRKLSDLPAWAREFFEALGLDDKKVKFVRDYLSVENLIIPGQGHTIAGISYGDHLRFLASIFPQSDNVTGGPEKVYLSRSRLSKRLIAGETKLENVLKKSGFDVFHPQDHSVRKQIEVISNARVLVGFRGSAFFNLYLLHEFPGRAYVLPRHKTPENNYQALGESMQLTILNRDRVMDFGKDSWVDMNGLLEDLYRFGITKQLAEIKTEDIEAEYALFSRFYELSAKNASGELNGPGLDDTAKKLIQVVKTRPVFHDRIIPFCKRLPTPTSRLKKKLAKQIIAAVSVDPRNGRAFFELALTLKELKFHDSAKYAYKEAKLLTSDKPKYVFWLTRLTWSFRYRLVNS